MGVINSTLGTIRQNIDNLNFRTWKNKNVVARKVTQSNQPNSASQQAQKRKFALLVHWSRLLASSINTGFAKAATTMTVFNKFVSRNMAHVTDNGTAASLTYADLQISEGVVLGPGAITAVSGTGAGNVDMTIVDNSNGTTGLSTDSLRVAWINTADGTAGEVNPSKTRTSAAVTFSLALGAANEGDAVKLYPYFIRSGTGDCSDNGYASVASV